MEMRSNRRRWQSFPSWLHQMAGSLGLVWGLGACAGASVVAECVDESACPAGFRCVDTACVQACVDSTSCGAGSYCVAGACESYECRVDSDCHAQFVCHDIETTTDCQGYRTVAACRDGVCVHLDDDTGCEGRVHACANNFMPVTCTGAADATAPICASVCETDANCLPGYRCSASGSCDSDTGGQPPLLAPAPDQHLAVGILAAPLNLAGYVMTTDGDAILEYSLISGSLPAGLGLNAATGQITGIPQAASLGTSDVTWTARDKDGVNPTGDTVQFTVVAPGNCVLPWGGSMTHGSTVTAYVASTVACGNSCAFEQRLCDNGTLSGSYTAQACVVASCQPEVIFSKTSNGAAESQFDTMAPAYGRILNLSAGNAATCMETVGVNTGACVSPAAWASAAANGWVYNATSGEWRFTINARAFVPGIYKFYARNTDTATTSAGYTLNFNGAPVLVFSESPTGPAGTTFDTSSTIYQRIHGLSASNAQACAEFVGVNDGLCNALGNWTTFPTSGWSYHTESGQWRSTIAPFAFPPGLYKNLARNTTTGVQSVVVMLTLAGAPVFVLSNVLNGPSQSSFSVSQTVYMRMHGLSATNGQGCTEAIGINDDYCDADANFTNFPANGWSYDAAASQWRATIAPNTIPAGSYLGYGRNRDTGQRSAGVGFALVP